MAAILVVDDELDNRLLLKAILTPRGHLVYEASRGDEGLALARLHRPQLIVLDLHMPGMDGPEFVRKLRSEPAIADSKLALYSSTSLSPPLQDFMTVARISCLIPKPGEPEEVLRIVEEALKSP
jgi:CheY-like chemotaxis protein